MKVGLDASLTGADSESAIRVRNGVTMALEEANDSGAIPGVKLELVVFDDGTPTAGQYDPAQAATNARKMVSDHDMVASVGPQMSGA
ncbi:MAG: ABC transporter substrate-binding protein, partial [Acetobacteraceae bacterium]|nr:ABC transporter substrate-binding protein [Acetobacteraceae bacterium]